MSYTSLLINYCAVWRQTLGGVKDAYGKPAPDWALVDAPVDLSDIPCRLMATGGKEIIVGAEVVVADYKLFLGDVVVTEQDRVNVGVKDPAGAWVWVMYEILMVKDIQDSADGHHKECFLRTVR